MVGGANRTLANHGRSNQSINVLNPLDLGFDNAHPLHDNWLRQSSSMNSTIYNTVILASIGRYGIQRGQPYERDRSTHGARRRSGLRGYADFAGRVDSDLAWIGLGYTVDT